MSRGRPVVSTVIPTHNRLAVLERALASVVDQTRPPDEIIVVDDGSTDGTGELIRSKFPQVVCISQDRRGVSAARNVGASRAAGNWIAFLDSDDEWKPRKLERQLEKLDERPEYRLCHTDEIWIRNGRRVNPKQRHAKAGGYIFQRCLPLCAISPSSVLIQRTLLGELGGFDERLPVCEDYDLWLRVCASHPVLFVDEPLVVKYGGHDDQLSRRFPAMDRFRIQALEKVVRDGELSDGNRAAATRVLLEKIDIHIQGARKRGRLDEVEWYEAKRGRYV